VITLLKFIFALIATITLALLMSYIKFRCTTEDYCPLWLLCITIALWLLAFFFALLVILHAAGAAMVLPVLKLFGLAFI
jgi:hypothetical protein